MLLIICSIWLCNKDRIINQAINSGPYIIAELVLALDNLNTVDSLTAEEYSEIIIWSIQVYLRRKNSSKHKKHRKEGEEASISVREVFMTAKKFLEQREFTTENDKIYAQCNSTLR